MIVLAVPNSSVFSSRLIRLQCNLSKAGLLATLQIFPSYLELSRSRSGFAFSHFCPSENCLCIVSTAVQKTHSKQQLLETSWRVYPLLMPGYVGVAKLIVTNLSTR